MTNEPIDILIPFHPKDSPMLARCIESCRRHIPGVRRIILVSGRWPDLSSGCEVVFYRDDDFFPSGPNRACIYRKLFLRNFHIAWRAGWLFQQFVKLGAPRVIADLSRHYLVVDSDVVFLKDIALFHDGRALLVKEPRGYPPDFAYYKTYEHLFGEPACSNEYSFIANYMVFDAAIVEEMLRVIEQRSGAKWHDAVIRAMDCHGISEFSEFESYGLYLQHHHPDRFRFADVVGLQDFREIPEDFSAYADRADFVTAHEHMRVRGTFRYKVRSFMRYWGLLRE